MPLRSIARLIQTMLYAQRFFPYYVYNILGGIEEDGTSSIPICDMFPHADCYLTDDSTLPASSQLPFVLGSTIHTYIPSVYPPIFAYHPLWSPFIISPPSLNALKALEPCIHSIQLAPTSAKHVVQPVPLSPSYNHSWITRYGSTCLFTPFLLLVIKVHLN